MAVTTFSTSQERQKCANKEQGCGDDGKQGNRDRDTYGGDQHQHCRGHGPHDRASPAPTSPTRQKNKVDQPSPTTVSAPSASKKPPIPPTTNANAEHQCARTHTFLYISVRGPTPESRYPSTPRSGYSTCSRTPRTSSRAAPRCRRSWRSWRPTL